MRMDDLTALPNLGKILVQKLIQGIRWHDLDQTRKKELREFFDHLK